MSDSATEDSAALRWRIPQGRSRTTLRFALVQIGFASVVMGMLVVLLTPAAVQGGLLTATIVISLLLAGFRVARAIRTASGPPNVWLDATGLHWLDAAGSEHTLARQLTRSFYLGHDVETHRRTPSLTLVLEQGFISQPVELHAPAEEAVVRQWLESHWSLEETRSLPDDALAHLAVSSEIDVPHQHWILQGSPVGLRELAATWRDAAQFSLPPEGARPKQIEMQFDFGEPVGLAVSPHTWIDGHLFAASPELLVQLASDIESQLSATPVPAEFEIPIVTDTGHHWKLVFAVDDEAKPPA